MSDTVEKAVREVAAGRPVIVLDGESRENEGDLIFAAELATPELMGFMVRHTSGFVCVAIPGEECDRLALPPMHHTGGDAFGTAYRVTVDAVGVGTGISARDRARTVRTLADPAAEPGDLMRPGHVVPLAARPGGVLARPGHTEAGVDLTTLAGLRPAGVLCEIVSARRPAQMARRDELAEFAATHGLATITIDELAAYRRAVEQRVERVASTRLPVAVGELRAVGYRAALDGTEHVALVAGDLAGRDVPVHVHVECLLGDVFGGRLCHCGARLETAVREITARGRGVVVYLRPAARSALHGLTTDRAGCSMSVDDRRLADCILRDLGVASANRAAPAGTDLVPAA